MKISLAFIRIFFTSMCVLFFTLYMTTTTVGGFNFTNVVIGCSLGVAFALTLVSIDVILKRFDFHAFNIVTFGLFFGYLLGEAVLLTFNAILTLSSVNMSPESITLFKSGIFLFCAYLGMVMIARAADEWHLSIPFIKFKTANHKRKDTLVDWSILLDARVIELASSGLLDGHLVMPRFMLKELYNMLESTDEVTKAKAKRCLEVFKKLESMPTLDLRHLDTDFPDTKDSILKLVQLARLLDASIITSEMARLQHAPTEGIKIIDIRMISNAWKPMTGECINIKIQRYGKEPRQGVGYLEDGTMVVVNGGAEFIGDTIKAQVLSVKHTSSGRMIFCNAAEEMLLNDQELKELAPALNELESAHKNYF